MLYYNKVTEAKLLLTQAKIYKGGTYMNYDTQYEEIYSSSDNTANKAKKKRRYAPLIIVISVVLCAAIVAGTFFILPMFNTTEEFSDTGGYSSFGEGFTDVKITDEESAIEAVASVADMLGIKNAEEELKVSTVSTSGTDTFYRMQQYYEGIPFYGKNIVVAAYEDGASAGLVSNFLVVDDDFDTTADITLQQAQDAARAHLNSNDIEFENTESDLVLYEITPNNTQEGEEATESEIVLAYHLVAKSGYNLIIDANTADVLASYSNITPESVTVQSKNDPKDYTFVIYSATGSKNSNNEYLLRNEQYNIEIFDFDGINSYDVATELDKQNLNYYDFNNYGVSVMKSTNDKFDRDAILTMNKITNIVEFYKNLGHQGFDSIDVAIHDLRDGGTNAFGGSEVFNGKSYSCVFIGKENVISNIIDTIGHEYQHGVTDSFITYEQTFSKDIDAINEAFSDIFGELIEAEINNKAPDWQGTDRNMCDPYSQGLPATMDQLAKATTSRKYSSTINKHTTTYCLHNPAKETSYSHFACTIISHAAYLMNTGVDYNPASKINEDKLAELWYKALQLLPNNASFTQLRNSVELAAGMMLHHGKLTSEQLSAVFVAFTKVGIERDANAVGAILKNKFSLNVTNINGNGNLNYQFCVVKYSDWVAYNKNISKVPKVMDKTYSKGNLSCELKNGEYLLYFKDLGTKNGSVMTYRVKVDSSVKDAVGKTNIQTNFTEIIVAVLDPNKDTKPGDVSLYKDYGKREYYESTNLGSAILYDMDSDGTQEFITLATYRDSDGSEYFGYSVFDIRDGKCEVCMHRKILGPCAGDPAGRVGIGKHQTFGLVFYTVYDNGATSPEPGCVIPKRTTEWKIHAGVNPDFVTIATKNYGGKKAEEYFINGEKATAGDYSRVTNINPIIEAEIYENDPSDGSFDLTCYKQSTVKK